MRFSTVSTIWAMLVGGAITSACTVAPDAAWDDCDPDPRYPTGKLCVDAGADAAADASDEDAGLGTPGSDPQSTSCQTGGGRCVPVPSGGEHAGLWSEVPIALWVGPAPKEGDPPLQCPGDTSSEKFRLYSDLVAPPAECEPCECGPSSGTCTDLPASIEVRAGVCGEAGAMSVPFDGPAGWDGSCTSTNALPAGADCGGEPCAQSILISALPGPTTEEPCSPVEPVPDFATKTEWKTAVLGCSANVDDDSCRSRDESCVADPGPEYLHCVFRAGEYTLEECPRNYRYAKYVGYPKDAVDDRGCEACACGPPEGSGCLASLRLYSNPGCSAQFEQSSISSNGEKCTDIHPPGRAIAAKSIEDMAYMPGECASTGGTPTGAAFRDVTGAVTFCCIWPFYIDIN